MKNKVIIIAIREYLRNVKKVSFWAATLLLPLFMLIISLISGFSSKAVEDQIKKEAENARAILIHDDANLIAADTITAPLKLVENRDENIELVKRNEADAYIYIPQDVATSNVIEIYVQAKGIFYKDRYNSLVQTLIRQNILSRVGDESQIKIFNAGQQFKVTSFKDGQVVDESYEALIVPIAAVALYFLLLSFANSFLLNSVSEEKENRMIEIVLTSIKPKTLIFGKVIGQITTVLTQLIVLMVLGGLAFRATTPNLPIDISKVQLDFSTVVMGIFYVMVGFLIMGNIMVAVGAAMPSYKEAQSFSSVFIILSIFPVYFFSIILADPNGIVSLVTSYFPLTAPMILLLRYTLGVMSLREIIFSSAIIMLYAYLTYIIAVKLFEFGALEYSKKLSLKSLWIK